MAYMDSEKLYAFWKSEKFVLQNWKIYSSAALRLKVYVYVIRRTVEDRAGLNF